MTVFLLSSLSFHEKRISRVWRDNTSILQINQTLHLPPNPHKEGLRFATQSNSIEDIKPLNLQRPFPACQKFSIQKVRLVFPASFCILDCVGANSRLVLWAQRSSATEDEKNIVYLSVNAADLQHPKVDLNASGVTVEGVQKGTEAVYKVVLEFFEDIDVSVPSPFPPPRYLMSCLTDVSMTCCSLWFRAFCDDCEIAFWGFEC